MKPSLSRTTIHFLNDETEELVFEIPSWITRWGIVVMLFIFGFAFGMCCIVQYPDVIKGKVVIMSSPQPLSITSLSSGNIQLLRKENEILKKGDLIGWVQTSAVVSDVLRVDSLLTTFNLNKIPNSGEYVLGELQPYFSSLIASLEKLRISNSNSLSSKQEDALRRQERNLRSLGAIYKTQDQLNEQDLVIAKEKFVVDSVLFQQNVHSVVDYKKAKSEFLQQQRALATAKAAVALNDIQINSIEKAIEEIKAHNKLDSVQNLISVENARQELISRISEFKRKYLFITPVEGQLAFHRFLESGFFVEPNIQLFTIIPHTENVFAIVEFPVVGSGKAKLNQQVNIKLDNFPHEQFGTLRGTIVSISALPYENGYSAKVKLNDRLRTNFNVELAFRHQLQGQTEIIIENISLAKRMFFYFLRLNNSATGK